MSFFIIINSYITQLIHICPELIIIVPLKVFYLHLRKPIAWKFAMQLWTPLL